MLNFLFLAENILIGALVLAVTAIVFAQAGRRARARSVHRSRLGVALLMLGLLCTGWSLASIVSAYRPFEPRTTNLDEVCHFTSGDGRPEADVNFVYDAKRQCQHTTFYEALPMSLQRVVLSTIPRRPGPLYQARQLVLEPDFGDPSRRGVFTRKIYNLSPSDFLILQKTRGSDPFPCPDSGDASGIEAATTRVAALRSQLESLSKSPPVVTRWRCSPRPVSP